MLASKGGDRKTKKKKANLLQDCATVIFEVMVTILKHIEKVKFW